MMPRLLIDRTTNHTCPKQEAEKAYMASYGRALFECVSEYPSCPRIDVQYVYFPVLCANCRIECTDDSDVEHEPTNCVYCGEEL